MGERSFDDGFESASVGRCESSTATGRTIPHIGRGEAPNSLRHGKLQLQFPKLPLHGKSSIPVPRKAGGKNLQQYKHRRLHHSAAWRQSVGAHTRSSIQHKTSTPTPMSEALTRSPSREATF